jgi:uncharacterized Ntn-hydrolase superfamily protein
LTRSSSRALFLFFLALSLSVAAARPAEATWSILLADTATGEVAIGSATCLDGPNLHSLLPVIRVGVGVGAAQATVNLSARNRRIIWSELQKGTHPQDIVAHIKATDEHAEWRQIGVVDVRGQGAFFNGKEADAWTGGVTGVDGSVRYVILGNLLAGEGVVKAAEEAVVNSSGDLAARLMAGMHAAREMGGDGRCSCDEHQPTKCGSPPASFAKSSHVAAMILARVGDLDGTCVPHGCANGEYFLDLGVSGSQVAAPDPVVQLQGQYDAWRASLVGRPDQLNSEVVVPRAVLAPGERTELLIALADWRGELLTEGGADVFVSRAPGSACAVDIGEAVDHGDGTYTVPLVGRFGAGSDVLRIVVDDGRGPVTLFPFTEIEVRDEA